MPRRTRPTDITPLPADGWGRRRLPYPYYYDGWLRQPLEYDPVDTVGEFTGVCDVFTLALTPEENLRFSSALMLGAMIAYPTDWMRIWDLWQSALNLVNTYDTGGCGVGDDIFCARVRECLRDYPPGDEPGKDDFPPIEESDLNIICGSIEFAVEEIIQQGEVVLTLIDAVLSVADALAGLVQTFGRFGAIPTAVQGAVSGLYGAVAAAQVEWSQQSVEDAIRCGIYCAVETAGGPPYTLSESVLRDGYDRALDAIGANTLAGLTLQATWYFIPKRLIASRFQVGISEGLTSPLCDTLCEPCDPVWQVEWSGLQLGNLTITDGSFDSTLQRILGGYVQGNDGDWANRVFVRWSPGAPVTFTGAGVVGVIDKGTWIGGTNNMLSVDTAGYQHRFLEQVGVATGDPGAVAYDEPALTIRSASQIEFTARSSRSPNPIAQPNRGVIRIDRLTVYGEGAIPPNLQGGTLTVF